MEQTFRGTSIAPGSTSGSAEILIDGPRAFDVPEVIARLGVTRPTVYRFLQSGELRSFRLGSRRLVSAEALAEFIRERERVEAD
jgi:excisionase family DNA binding protein